MGGRGASFGGGGGSPSYVSLWEREEVNNLCAKANQDMKIYSIPNLRA